MSKKLFVLLGISLFLSACGSDHQDEYYVEDVHYPPAIIHDEATGVDVPNDACAEDKLSWLDTFGTPDAITTWQDHVDTSEEYSLCEVSIVTFTYTEGTNYCAIDELHPPHCS